jgi:hypothetical protein
MTDAATRAALMRAILTDPDEAAALEAASAALIRRAWREP